MRRDIQSTIESLENRRLLSGTITVSTTGAAIVIRGDAADNVLSIDEFDVGDGTPSGGAVLRSSTGTIVVDGKQYDRAAYFPLGSVAAFAEKPWDIDMGDGDDSLGVVRYEASIPSLVVKLGDGDDRFSVNSQFYAENIGPTAIDGGAGDDTVYLGNMGGNVSIFTGPGRDRVLVPGDEFASVDPQRRTRILGKLYVYDMQGRTQVDLNYVDVRKEVLISTGNSIDHIRFSYASFKRHVTVVSRGGADVLTNENSAFHGWYTLPSNDPVDVVRGFLIVLP